ncbi:MAG: nitroreductase family protein [Armatimonadota bacterium]
MPLDTVDTIMQRRSIRKYKREPIPEEDLRTILEAGRQAPSAGNRQPWEFIVVRDEQRRKDLAQACKGQTWMADAAVTVCGIGLPQASERWWRVDTAIAMENMILAAWALGHGTCWIGAFEEAEVKQVLGVPDEARVVALTPIGVPDVCPEARPRREWSEVFHAEQYGEAME